MPIRPYRPDDFAALFAANEASVPGVGAETEESLANWISMATCLVATDAEDQALGFITVMELGQLAYDSPNMRWFERYAEETGKSVVYVDRIALLPAARGQRLGEALYLAAFEHFKSRDEIGCEVNTLPPNPGSHRFHERLGFKSVGETTYREGEKAVMFYARPLG
ncbi:MAG: GNAT family N-acetyltransferase [Pseudomonadota bacterium]